MMTTENGVVACGKCKVPIEGPEGDDPQDVFSCPSCGRSDSRENVMAVVSAFVTDHAARAMQDAAKDVADKVKWITYTETTHIPEREYQFIWIAS